MRIYPRLTVADHVAFGNVIKAAYRTQSQVRAAYPKSSRASRAAVRTEKALGVLKSALDEEVHRLVPIERDPRHLTTRVYYGKPFVATAHDDPNDAFAGWEAAEP
jgi:hypothetical protein